MRIDLKGIRALRPCLLAHFHGAHAVTTCGTEQHLRKPYRLINQGNPSAQYWKFQCTLQWRSAFPARGRDATRFQVFAKGAKPALSVSRSLIDLSNVRAVYVRTGYFTSTIPHLKAKLQKNCIFKVWFNNKLHNWQNILIKLLYFNCVAKIKDYISRRVRYGTAGNLTWNILYAQSHICTQLRVVIVRARRHSLYFRSRLFSRGPLFIVLCVP